jgi:hypothetical protein
MKHFFITKFVNGLRKDIKCAICLHHHRTVDTALSLAQTREEMMEELRPYSSSSRFKHAYNSSYSKRVAFLARAFCLTKPNIKSKLSTSRIGRASFNHSMLREEQEVNVSSVETNSNLDINADLLELVKELLEILQLRREIWSKQ